MPIYRAGVVPEITQVCGGTKLIIPRTGEYNQNWLQSLVE